MELPKQAREAGERADALIGAMRDGKTPGDDPGEASDKGQAAPEEHEARDPGHPSEPTEEGWKTRFHVLQGKYDAEVPNLQRQLRDLEARYAGLLAEHSALQRDAAGNKRAEADPQGMAKALDPDAFGDYGEEFQNLVKEFQRATGELAAAKDKIAALEGRVGDVSQQQASTAAQTFVSQLDAKLPSWREWNDDPRWHDWLLKSDRATGIVRQAILERAEKAHDVERIKELFTLWRESLSEAAPDKGKGGANAPDKRLERLVTPGKAAGSPSPGKAERVWSSGEIKEFYRKKAGGLYAGREEEAKALEEDILLASKEGRVRR
ncbi:MAG: hypothetical protein AAGU21_01025 [Solidesulfovibrio sp.]|uniref:hypothetical protein n=1 Tax=Solidesulfovibrio sp. TaxID=2910990 RepID=UPI003157F2B1